MNELKKAAIKTTQDGYIAEARPMWLRMCELEPLDNDNWLFLSTIDARLGFTSSAREHLNYPLNRDLFDYDVWLQASNLSYELGRFEDGLRLVRAMLRHDFTDIPIRQKIARWCLEIGKIEEASHHFHYCTGSNPEPSQDWASLLCSALLLDNSQTSEAVKHQIERAGDLIDGDMCSEALKQWHLLTPPEDWYKLSAVLSKLPAATQEKMRTHAAQISIPKADYYRATAHTRAQLPDEKADEIAAYIAKSLPFDALPSLTILEIGAGVGKIAIALREKVERTLSIIGTTLIDQELAHLERNNAYDLVLSNTDALANSVEFDIDVLVLSLQARQLLSEDEIENIIGLFGAKTTIVLQLDSSQSQQTISARINGKDGCDTEFDAKQSKQEPRRNNQTKVVSDTHLQPAIKTLQALRRNQFDQACEFLDQVPHTLDNHSSISFLKGVISQHKKDYKMAVVHLSHCIRTNRFNADAWFHLAAVWQKLGRQKSAIRAYEKVLLIAPEHQIAAKNLISIRSQAKGYDQVGIILQRLILNYPINQEIKQYAAKVVAGSGKQDFAAWLNQFYQRKLFLQPAFNASLKNKFLDRAARILRTLKHQISETEAELLAISLDEKSDRHSDALARINKLIAVDKSNINLHTRARSILMATGNQQAALEIWRAEIANFEASNGNFSGALFIGNYFADLQAQELANAHFAWGSKLAEHQADVIEFKSLRKLETIKSDRKKIRIGYMSGDFKTHSVSLFLYNLYLYHDREKFEIYSYSTHYCNDLWALRYELRSDRWRDVSKLNTVQLVNQLRSDKLDILVDLSGHTGHNRLQAFALRCAPIQGTYLGYANTTGLESMDFRLSDEVADPIDQPSSLHTETIEHIEGGFLSYRREFGAPPVRLGKTSPKTVERHYTYVCCNNIFKITPEALTLFAAILQKNPGSTMLIKAHNLDNQDLRQTLYALFEKNGVDSARIHLMNALDLDDHQALYNHTDVALDPFPYNGTTTSCDALWMGVPMIALRGSRHSARVGASILTTIGREEWIAENHNEYIHKAVNLAQDSARLRIERLRLRRDMLHSPLMLPHHTVERIEEIYQRLVTSKRPAL
jgi:predicted O-linked N-acetylglucosamine transferase (SPINDLY family)